MMRSEGNRAPLDMSGGWPGVAGFSHDGATYCIDCAEENADIDTTLARKDDSQLAYTGLILGSHEFDREVLCATCERTLQVRTYGNRD